MQHTGELGNAEKGVLLLHLELLDSSRVEKRRRRGGNFVLGGLFLWLLTQIRVTQTLL
jgi:hypothetical protein